VELRVPAMIPPSMATLRHGNITSRWGREYSYPHYPGARGVQNLLFPFIDAEYANRFYIDAHWNGLAEWQLFGKYRLGASASFAHLQGDAANSPITLRHEQTTLTGWLVHRFN
jgi:hypothetical protein